MARSLADSILKCMAMASNKELNDEEEWSFVCVVPRTVVTTTGLSVLINAGDIVYKQKAGASEAEVDNAIGSFLRGIELHIREGINNSCERPGSKYI